MCDVTVEHGGHVTPPNCCTIKYLQLTLSNGGTCLSQCCVATFAAQHSQCRKRHFLLLLHNHRVYRGAAYDLPQQIRYNINKIYIKSYTLFAKHLRILKRITCTATVTITIKWALLKVLPQFIMCCIYPVTGKMTCMVKTHPLNAIPQDFIPQFLFNTTDNADGNAGHNVTIITYFTNPTAFQTAVFYLY